MISGFSRRSSLIVSQVVLVSTGVNLDEKLGASHAPFPFPRIPFQKVGEGEPSGLIGAYVYAHKALSLMMIYTLI